MARDADAAAWTARFGPWAIVTGASDGIGRAVAIELARRGINLVLVARRQGLLDDVAAHCRAEHGVDVVVVSADLATPAGVARVADAAGRRDIGLVVAAAGFGTSGAVETVAADDDLAMVDVNCRAVVDLVHRFVPRLVSRGRGGLVLFSSLLAFQGVPRAATYAATKAFIQTFAEGLGAELRGRGISVLATAPGPVRSGFESRADMRMAFGAKPEAVARATIAALAAGGTVRPGWLSKALEISLLPLPRSARTRMMGLVMRDMTKHRDAAATIETGRPA